MMVNLVQDINSTGFVGIGWVDYTETPIYPLHVKGDGYFENSNLTVDKTVTTTTVKADTVGEDEKTFLFGYGSVPIGTVLPWSGEWDAEIEAIMNQKGWVLCDERGIEYTDLKGRSKTVPDLRGRFIVGFDSKKIDTDYDAVGKSGPDNDQKDYGEVNGVPRSEFYELEEGGKRVKLLEPAMPRHNHGADNLEHKHEINFTDKISKSGTSIGHSCPNLTYSEDVKAGIDLNTSWVEGANKGDKYDMSCSYKEKRIAVLGPKVKYTEFSYSYVQEKGKGYTNNASLTLDKNGGYKLPTNPEYETAMPIENRPPYYVLAYIIRIK